MTTDRARLVVLASGGGTNLQAILSACGSDTIHADVVAVISDRAGAGALERARSRGVPALHLDPRTAPDRRTFDASLATLVASYEPTFVVLAGWMRVLSGDFLTRFPDRVLNLHPARPGELPGMHAIERAFAEYRAGARTSSGVMVHTVPDERVDAGPVLATIDVHIEPTDTLDSFEQRMHAAEHVLLVEVLASLCAPTAPTEPTPPTPPTAPTVNHPNTEASS